MNDNKVHTQDPNTHTHTYASSSTPLIVQSQREMRIPNVSGSSLQKLYVTMPLFT
jgi:hypothetical protein